MGGPLSGIKILDLSRLLPGPFATMLLADMGAEIVKVEDPNGGDYGRWAPPLLGNLSAHFHALNRNKKSITLNLKHPQGASLFLQLVKKFDIVLEQFRPGVMERLGVGYQDARKANARIVYCSLTGYGATGPYRDRAGHDLNYMGIAGAASITGPSGGPPVVPGVQVGDIGGGALMCAIGMLAALHHRDRVGEGQFVDVSMTDGIVSWMALQASDYFANPQEEPRPGDMRLNGGLLCYRIYESADGRHLTMGALEPKFWEAFCRAVGKENLIAEQYSMGPAQEKPLEELEALFRSKTFDEWVAFCSDKDLMLEPILTFGEAFSHPQIKAREMVMEIDDPRTGPQKQLGFPIKFSETPGEIRSTAPELGQHTEEVLVTELEFSREKIAELRQDNVI
ncbi:MAG: CaiB/BaiF CoA-transferase family protein [Deltaproteobacteria bacterium]|nr:CaiB/BaiF CoA-transferase family protein [Deltaproteobacteria bacterium]